jgi:hypothetical protein
MWGRACCSGRLAYRQIRDKGLEALPYLAPICTYIALAPLSGLRRRAGGQE